jgi:putative transposase
LEASGATTAANVVTGVKRHIVVDVLGLLITVVVTAANFDDGTHASLVLSRLTAEHLTRLEVVWGDNKYNNKELNAWMKGFKAKYRVEVVKRPPGSKGFVLLPRRWVVERTFAWLGRYRRHSRDYERCTTSSESMIRVSSVHRMLKLLSPDKSKPLIPFKYRETQEIITG